MLAVDSNKIYKIILLLIVVGFIVFGVLYATKTASWERPDEFSHFTYIKYIEKFNSLPSYTSVYDFWEAHQPPLYYLLMSPVLFLFSFQEIEFQLYALRVVNLIFAVVNIFVLYKVFSFLFKKISAKKTQYLYTILSTLLAAFWPMYIYISSSVNNDNLANLIGSLIIFFIIRLPGLFNKDRSLKEVRRFWLLGAVLIAASLLTKTSLYVLALAFFGLMVYYFWKYLKTSSQFKVGRLVVYIVVAGLVIAVIAGWFFVRNIMVAGDLFGWKHFNNLLQHQESNLLSWPGFTTWIKMIIKSTLGIFGYLNISIRPAFTYQLFYIFLFVSFVGNIIFFIKRRAKQTSSLVILYFLFLLILAGTFIYSLSAFQPQGRYLFPCLASIILFIIIGTVYFIKREVVLKMLIIILLIVLPVYAGFNLGTIQQAEFQLKAGDNQDHNNLLSKAWNSDYANVQKKESAYGFIESMVVEASAEGPSRFLAFGDLKLETTSISKLWLDIKTTEVKKIHITPTYIAYNFFNRELGQSLVLETDDEFHTYTIDFDKIEPAKPDIVTGLEIAIMEGGPQGSTSGTIEFKNMGFN